MQLSICPFILYPSPILKKLKNLAFPASILDFLFVKAYFSIILTVKAISFDAVKSNVLQTRWGGVIL